MGKHAAEFCSDHYIVVTTVHAGPQKKKGRKLALVEWDTFRKIREEDGEETILDIEKWVEKLLQSVKKATEIVPEEAAMEEVDSKLLHMWEAKNNIQKRWKSQKHNRNLRKKVAALDKEIEVHANRLTQQHWEATCNLMGREIRMSKTWNILRSLLDPQSTQTAQRHNLQQVVHNYAGTEEELFHELRQKYFTDTTTEPLPVYKGQDNVKLDASISEAEVRFELALLNPRSAPGPDGITNKTLRTLDDESIKALTEYMNKCWESGTIPIQWKTAQVIMITKPGKKPQLDNLRPISLTSCIGKLMEHVILTRLTNHMEENGLFPHTMIGFRPKLSTQDIMLQLKHQILDEGTRSLDSKVILGLDLTKAFDTITHRAILENLQGLGIGQRTYAYVKDFLSNRTGRVAIGAARSEEIEFGSRGTPQGSVLSPFLFNVAMIGLPAELDKIEGLRYSVYADDITFWMTGGSDGKIKEILQEAVHRVERYVEGKGLKCSP